MRTGLETARAAEGTLGAHGHGPARRVAVSLGASARGACEVSQGAGGSVRGKSRRPGFDLSTRDDAVITGMVGGLGTDAPRRGDTGHTLTALTSNESGSWTK